ncbi:hypothetical protein DFH27DRAFT_199947 [Peziza echinospora]|nr:hypothetical protein DFH27DRAFT_199947 [Peziza echinospora]
MQHPTRAHATPMRNNMRASVAFNPNNTGASIVGIFDISLQAAKFLNVRRLRYTLPKLTEFPKLQVEHLPQQTFTSITLQHFQNSSSTTAPSHSFNIYFHTLLTSKMITIPRQCPPTLVTPMIRITDQLHTYIQDRNIIITKTLTHPQVSIPQDLIRSQEINRNAKIIKAAIHMTSAPLSYTDLSQVAQLYLDTLVRNIDDSNREILRKAGWAWALGTNEIEQLGEC